MAYTFSPTANVFNDVDLDNKTSRGKPIRTRLAARFDDFNVNAPVRPKTNARSVTPIY